MPAQAGTLLPLRLSPPLARTPCIPFMMKGFFQTERKKVFNFMVPNFFPLADLGETANTFFPQQPVCGDLLLNNNKGERIRI